jgi:hypothetical protein
VDRELQRYYEDRFSMMITPGWKDLIEDIEKMIEAYDKVERLTNLEDLYYAKGQLDILRWILTLKQTSEEAFKELSDEKDI